MNLDAMKITFGVYLVFLLVLGVAAYLATKNFDDYILGGRSLGSFVTALSAGASDMSGWLLMGLPGAILVSGLTEAWIGIGLVLGAYANWLFVASRLRVYTEQCNNALTIPDYLTSRLDAKTPFIRIVTAIIILVFFTVYCASGVVAGARLFESLFDVDYNTAMLLGASVTIFYTFIGGFLAVSWTDTLQAALMFFALIAMPIIAYLSLGGAHEVTETIRTFAQTHPDFNNTLFHGSVVAIISALAWGLGYLGQPHILCRFMAIGSVKQMRNARRIGMVWMILCLAGAIGVGYMGVAYFQNNPQDAQAFNVIPGQEDGAERVFIALTTILLNPAAPWIAGIILSAILAAIMSTLSCQLLVSSSAIAEDLYKGLLRPNASPRELVWLGRMMVLVVAAIALFIARDPNSKVLDLVSYAWAGFGAAFGPLILLSLYTRRISEWGAFAGMVTGAVVVVLWANVPALKDTGLYEILPGFIASFVVTLLVSSIAKPSQGTLEAFARSKQAYNAEKH